MAVEKKIFARKASGLIRQIGWLDAMFLALASINPGAGALVYFTFLPANYGGCSIPMYILTAALLSTGYVLLYAQFSSAMPRSGGEYMLVSRTFTSLVGFMVNWTLIIASLILIGGSLASLTASFSLIFWHVGLIFKNPVLLLFAVKLWDPEWMFIIGTICILAAFVLMVLPTRFTIKWLIRTFIPLGIAVMILSYILGFLSGPTVFQQNWNKLIEPFGFTTYDGVLALAEQFGLSYNFKNWLPLSIGASFMMFWAYNGAQSASYYAGELKESSKTLPIANLGSLFVAMIVFIIGGFVWPYVEGYKFLASTGYLFQFHLMEWGMLPTEVSFVLFPNLVWTIILFIALLGWSFTLIFMSLFQTSRCMFAWSFDRVVPEGISYVHPKWRTPVVAAALGTAVAWGGLLFSLSPWALWMVSMNYNFILITMMIIIAAAGIFFPFRKKEIFDMAPRWVRFKIGRVPFMSIWSLITLIISAGMLYTTVTIPAVGGYIDLGTFLFVAGLFIAGGIIYAVSRWYRLKKEGVDILMASKEVPPV